MLYYILSFVKDKLYKKMLVFSKILNKYNLPIKGLKRAHIIFLVYYIIFIA